VLGLRVVFGAFNGLGDPLGVPAAYQNEVFHFDDLTLEN
jgi:hypothetical protein